MLDFIHFLQRLKNLINLVSSGRRTCSRERHSNASNENALDVGLQLLANRADLAKNLPTVEPNWTGFSFLVETFRWKTDYDRLSNNRVQRKNDLWISESESDFEPTGWYQSDIHILKFKTWLEMLLEPIHQREREREREPALREVNVSKWSLLMMARAHLLRSFANAKRYNL